MADNTGVHPIAPHEAAAMIGVGVHSVRRWCEWHKPHLSPMANPGSGASRRLTRRDVEVLKTVRVLREQGLQTKTINERLENMAFADIDIEEQTDITEAPHVEQAGPGGTLVPVAVVEAIARGIAEQVRAELRDEIEPLQTQRLRFDAVWLAIAAFIAGLIVGLSVWWFQ